MLMDVYYKRYSGDGSDDQKLLPYAVHCENEDIKSHLISVLSRKGYECVQPSATAYTVILVNVELYRWAGMNKACKTSCVNDRLYSEEEFLQEILNK